MATVSVSAGQTTPLNATLTVGSANQQVVVNANLVGDAAAINEQRTSANILNVQTDTQIQSLPNANIADAIGRMPGVTLQRNEGEGQYVQIRGTEPRLSNTTIDGVIVPGPDPEVRQVDLDTIPAGIVGAVAINKTLSANQDGDAIGGSVDLRIKQATTDQPRCHSKPSADIPRSPVTPQGLQHQLVGRHALRRRTRRTANASA